MEREYNTIFIGLVLLAIIVLVGAGLVDSSLSRLLLPPEPFATVAVDYQHGIVIRGPESEISFKATKLATVAIEDERIAIRTGAFSLKIPFVLTWGNINGLRAALRLTK
ncbi:MAG: hypothetical protein ACOX2G_01275 [Bacillota bacterium]